MPRTHLAGTYGVLMNECWMLEEGFKRGLVKYDPKTYKYLLQGWPEQPFSDATKDNLRVWPSWPPHRSSLGRRWASDGLTILSWVLPGSFWRGRHTAKVEEQMKKFCELAHITFHPKPRWWASADGDMPPILKGVTQVCGELAAMQLECSPYWQPRRRPG